MSGTVLGNGNPALTKKEENPVSHGALEKQAINE